jgi:trimeric autotransporter adhesin
MISTFAGNGTAGFSGDGGPAASAELSSPSGLALSTQGVLYIADTGNNDIRYVGTGSSVIGTFAGNGMVAYAGDGSDAYAASLKSPAGVAVDAYGNVFIADTGNNVIREISLSGLASTVAGTTIGSFNGDGPATTSNLNAPQGLATDSADNLYIADTANNRIRLLSSGVLFTVAGGASAGSTGDGALSSLASLNQPGSVFLDTVANLIIADSANNKLRKIATGSAAVVFPTTNPASTSLPQTLLAVDSGLQSLTVSNPSVPSGFVLQPSGGVDCSSTPLLSSGTYCELQIAFAPPTKGNYAGNLVLTDNAQGATGATQSIGLTGVSADVFIANFAIGLPTTVVAGAAENVTVTVTNPSAAYTGTLHLTSSDPNAKLPADYTFTTADVGSHTFTGISLASMGIQTLTVTDTAKSTITATTSTTVRPGTATTLTIVSGNNQSVDLTASFQPLVVKATDAYGNPVSNATVTFTAPASGVSATFANGTSTTTAVSAATTGLASSSALKPVADSGTFTVLASSPGLSSVSFSLTNTSSITASLAITPSSSTAPYGLQPGGTESVTLSVVPAGGFSAAVGVTCSAPALMTCTVSPTPLTPTIGTATPFTVTLTGQRNADTETIVTHASIGLGIALLMAGFGRSRRSRIARLLLLLGAFALTMGASGCGGATAKNINAPNGLYPVVVTGTSGSLTSTATITFYVSGA